MSTFSTTRWAVLLYALPTILSAQQTPNDIVTSGPYVIQLCGARALQVQQDLDLIRTALPGVIAETHYGTESPAYRAFFKDSIYTTFVEELLTNITTGAPLKKLNSDTPLSPAIVCITGPNKVVDNSVLGRRDMWDECANHGRWPPRLALYLSDRKWIFLCPYFFHMPQEPLVPPNQTSVCPVVIGNRFPSGWSWLGNNQMYALMHELLHFYLGNSPPPARNTATEVNEIDAAVRLSSIDAISNAQSYVFYAAMVAANCTEFPMTTDDGLNVCRRRCLQQLGKPAQDVVDLHGTLSFDGV